MRSRKKPPSSPLPLIIFVIIISVLGIFFVLQQSNVFRFKTVEFSDSAIHIPQNPPLFFYRFTFSQYLFKMYPDIISVQLKPSYRTSVLFVATEREKPAARLCTDTCFLLGEHGYIIPELTSTPKHLFLITSNLGVIPYSVLEKPILSTLSQIIEFSNLSVIPLQSADILTNKDLRIKTQTGWYILINPQKDVDKQMRKLTYFVKNKSSQLNSIQYIDLRISQKIYYK